ncbi:sodium:proton antiporter [Intrasporangium chromatireducens Q5-1]|uniref:Sodium:proton antiporter n=1 Tax=Intrasporangium chromatireducens Q5-1 TaxID=584657 RepID=W9GP18_9MICO|nr:sodium:proton antiporter [Intrasporangium chromatireducens]EWT05629.1 sodium:proton antiporter [Intrasporangium chromatireducens Q5-1]
MDNLVEIIVLLGGTAVIVGIAERVRLPYPVLMLIAAAGVSLIPSVPSLVIPPELILPLFLPPLLFATAMRTSWSVFRVRWRSLVLLAFALVVVTAAVAAGISLAMTQTITVAGAVALGAIVAPPDPVAVESVSSKVGMPRRLTTVLQTEGLFNDAVAIVIFQAAVSAVVAGQSVGWLIVPQFLGGAALAAGLGFAMAWLVGWLTALLPNLVARSSITVVAPFAVYLIADELHASGVVAVVVTALELGRRSRPQDYAERLARQAFWGIVELLVTGLAFGLMGMELELILTDDRIDIVPMLPAVVAVCTAVVVVRLLWMLGIQLMGGTENRTPVPGSFKETLVLSWCGMRGLATMALALSLPVDVSAGTPFPGRAFIIVTALGVLISTLVVPGLTLPLLMRLLQLPRDPHAGRRRDRALAKRAQEASLKALEEAPEWDDLPDEARKSLRRRILGLERMLSRDAERDPQAQAHIQEQLAAVQRIQRRALNAGREEILRARREPGVDPMVADRVLHRLDLRTVMLDR